MSCAGFSCKTEFAASNAAGLHKGLHKGLHHDRHHNESGIIMRAVSWYDRHPGMEGSMFPENMPR